MPLRDQAGWHLSRDVAVPGDIILLPLPPKCPELNVMEHAGTTTTSPVTAATLGTV